MSSLAVYFFVHFLIFTFFHFLIIFPSQRPPRAPLGSPSNTAFSY